MASGWGNGASRIRLAKLIEQVCSTETRKVTCGTIRGSTGGRRNILDGSYIWSAQLDVTENGHTTPRSIGSYNTMKQCVDRGFALDICPQYGDWEIMAFGEKDGRWGCNLSGEDRAKFNVVVPKGVRV